MDQNSLSYKAFKNSSYSFLGYAFPIVFSIVVTPIIVKKLGVTDYGIYILMLTIAGFLGLLDLGLGLSVYKYTAEYYAKGLFKELGDLVGSVKFFAFGFGVFGWVVFLILGAFLPFKTGLSGQSHGYLMQVFFLAGLLFFVNSVFSVYMRIPMAMQRYDIGVKISLSQIIAFNLLSVALLFFGFRLKTVLIINIATSLGASLAMLYYSKKLLPNVSFKYCWSWVEIKKSYKFGLAAFITNISNNTLVQFDRLLIPLYLPAAQLSYYSLPGNVAEKINGLTGSVTGALFPMMSTLNVTASKEYIRSVYAKVFRVLMVFAAGLTVPIAVFAGKILLYWLGPEFAAHGTTVLLILAATNFLLTLYIVMVSVLLGLDRVSFAMKTSLFMAALNVVPAVNFSPKVRDSRGSLGLPGRGAAGGLDFLLGGKEFFGIFYWPKSRFLLKAVRKNCRDLGNLLYCRPLFIAAAGG